MNDPNVTVLELVVEAIGQLREELVLVGGCSVGLLITDRARPPVRETKDVDMVAEVLSLMDYYETVNRLKESGFKEAPDEDNMCRLKKEGLILDVLPSSEQALGHSTNRWYSRAAKTCRAVTLGSGHRVRVISAPLFIATKFEAFHGRGRGNYLGHDMEDIVNVVDGRSELLEEARSSDDDVREYLQEEFEALVADASFADALPGHFGTDATSQARVRVVMERIARLAGY